MTLRVGIDLRWLQRAHHNSPEGALGGVGSVVENLWRGLAAGGADIQLVGLLHHGPVPAGLRAVLESARPAEHLPVGIQGRGRLLARQGRVRNFLLFVESEFSRTLPLEALDLDVLHMTDHAPPPRHFSRASVLTLHAMFAGIIREGALSRYLYGGFGRATRIVAVSQAVASDYAAHIPSREITVVHNGIDLSIFRPAPPDGEARRRFGISAPYLLHVGVPTPAKNPAGMIAALGRLKRDGACPHLVSVGPYQTLPRYLAMIRQLAQEHGVADRLIVIERGCAPRDLAPLYRASLGLVFPSFEEGFGLPAIESLACGVPCIVSRVGGIPEVVGDLGIYVDPKDPDGIATGIRIMLADDAHRARVGREGPARAQNFSLQAMAANYLAVYRDVAARRA